LLLAGIGELESASHTISVKATDWSGTDLMLLGRMDSWRVSVDAAELRQAEDASILALLIPSSPSATGIDVCSHWSLFRSTIVMSILTMSATNGLALYYYYYHYYY